MTNNAKPSLDISKTQELSCILKQTPKTASRTSTLFRHSSSAFFSIATAMLSTSSASARRPEARRRCPYRNRRRGACSARFWSIQAKRFYVRKNFAGRKTSSQTQKKTGKLPDVAQFLVDRRNHRNKKVDAGLTLHFTPAPLEENKRLLRVLERIDILHHSASEVTVASFRVKHPICLHLGSTMHRAGTRRR